MKQSEKGSVTMIVVATIFFIVIILSSFFIYTTSRRRAQLEETERISNAYDGDMESIYEEINDRYEVKNNTNTENKASLYGLDMDNSIENNLEDKAQNKAENIAENTTNTNEINRNNISENIVNQID